MIGTRVGEKLEDGERKVVESELQSYLGSSLLPSQIPSKHFYSGPNQQNLTETANLNGGGGTVQVLCTLQIKLSRNLTFYSEF